MSTPTVFTRLTDAPEPLGQLRRYARQLFELPASDSAPDESELAHWRMLEAQSLRLPLSAWKRFHTTLPGYPYMLPEPEMRVIRWLKEQPDTLTQTQTFSALHAELLRAARIFSELTTSLDAYERPERPPLLSRLLNRSKPRLLPELSDDDADKANRYYADWPFEPIHEDFLKASSMMRAFLGSLSDASRRAHAKQLRPVALMARIWRLHPSVDVTEATKGPQPVLPESARRQGGKGINTPSTKQPAHGWPAACRWQAAWAARLPTGRLGPPGVGGGPGHPLVH